MFAQLENVAERKLDLEAKLSEPQLANDQAEFRRVAKEHAHLAKLDELYNNYKKVNREIADNRLLLQEEDDGELRELVRADLAELEIVQEELIKALRVALLPKNPNDDKNTLLEIRAGTGGDEAALFVSDLFRMYSRYAELQGWKVEVMTSNPTGIGGFKEIIALISGEQVYSKLKYESGAHRVQRVPETETQGRIHTSAVTVAVMPEAEEVEVAIGPNDLRFDVYRSTGSGGQSVNTTDSAVRVTHLPTGLVVTCQDEKSQHKNKAKALQVLRARLLDKMQSEQDERMSADRKSQVGSGDRSERIRTYNFPQGRVSDHRINLTLYQLDEIMTGKLDDIIDPLIVHFQTEALQIMQ
ncbi:MAG TPA: peptide chain release factor 1 [Desulfobulbaceae bacterium]|nr:MAG: peptide chain release factor 1 [Deltaproteobacteria bacterium RIFOXYD12_FULL_53_23]HCC54747.1 peptide chain release factor 1 [Desulfobulbaceae bacterium]